MVKTPFGNILLLLCPGWILAAGAWAAPAPQVHAAKPASAPVRVVLHFPKDRSVGWLYYFNDKARRADKHDLGWARGDVSVNKEAMLELRLDFRGSGDLSFIEQIDAPNIVSLDLGKMAVTDKDFKYISALKGLRQLNANDSDLDDEGMRELGTLQGLDELDICRTLVTAKGFPFVSKLKGLTRLDCSATQLNDSCLSSLRPLINLQALRLNRTGITDAGISQLCGFHQLALLKLNNNAQVTDKGMAKLQDLPLLSRLDVSDTGIGARSLPYFKRFPRLSTLTVSYRSFRSQDLAALGRALPRCRLLDGDSSGAVPMEIFNPLHSPMASPPSSK